MRYGFELLASLFALVALVGSGCGYYYKVMKQDPVDCFYWHPLLGAMWRSQSYSKVSRASSLRFSRASPASRRALV